MMTPKYQLIFCVVTLLLASHFAFAMKFVGAFANDSNAVVRAGQVVIISWEDVTSPGPGPLEVKVLMPLTGIAQAVIGSETLEKSSNSPSGSTGWTPHINNAYPGRKYVIELSDGATSVTSREFEVLPPVSDEELGTTSTLAVGTPSVDSSALKSTLQAQTSSTSTSTSISTSTPSPNEVEQEKGLSMGAKSGIGAGAAVGALAIIGVIVFVFLRGRRFERAHKEAGMENISPIGVIEKMELDAEETTVRSGIQDTQRVVELDSRTENTLSAFEMSTGKNGM